jgi:uncharacterized membrane protein (DUF373 family)
LQNIEATGVVSQAKGEKAANSAGGIVGDDQLFMDENVSTSSAGGVARSAKEIVLETVITRVQKLTVLALAVMLVVVLLLSTIHLGVLISEEVWKPPRWLIPVQGLLEIFGYFLLVLIGVELLETLKAYVKKDVIHVRVVLDVALIAMARKVIIEEPNTVPGLTLFGIAALILALGIAFYFERQAKREPAAG